MRQSIIKRFEELIKVGKSFPEDDKSIEWEAKHKKWRLSSLNLLGTTFGDESEFYGGFSGCVALARGARVPHETAILEGAKEEIEAGFLYKIEHLISSDFFDSVLETAKYLLGSGHKDSSAILGRVVIEKTLKQIADREGIALSEKTKLSKINEILRKGGIYDKIKWRLIQGYIDLGNYAAHGEFDKYTEGDVRDMLDWIQKSLMSL